MSTTEYWFYDVGDGINPEKHEYIDGYALEEFGAEEIDPEDFRIKAQRMNCPGRQFALIERTFDDSGELIEECVKEVWPEYL